MKSGRLEHLPKFDGELIRWARLHEKCRAPLTLRALAQRRCVVAREKDDGDIARSRLAFQIPNKLPSVTARQCQVSYDNVRVRFPGAPTSLRALGRGDRFETKSGKARHIQFAGVVVVVDDEHERPAGCNTRATAVHLRELLKARFD
jgi:hypothetical protein